jgi:hypothetical protein
MKQLLEALDLALEALEYFTDTSVSAMDHAMAEDAITAIKQARSAPVQEPVLQEIEQYRLQMAGISTAAIGYWKEGDGIHPDYDTPALRDVAKLYAKYDALYTAAQPTTEESSAVKPAAPVQEPDHGDELTIAYMSGLHDGKQKREWVGLTRDEVLSIGKELGLKCKLGGNANIDFDYAEAIEAKLKEKNNG